MISGLDVFGVRDECDRLRVQHPGGRVLPVEDWIDDTLRVTCEPREGAYFPLVAPARHLDALEEMFLLGVGLGGVLRLMSEPTMLRSSLLTEIVAACDVEVWVSGSKQWVSGSKQVAFPLADLNYTSTRIAPIHIAGGETYEVRVVCDGGEPPTTLQPVDLVFCTFRKRVVR